MDSDYKTIKEELKKELRQEMTAELRELAKQEIHNLIFKERYFEPALRTYIKSLLYEDIHYLRMLNRGMVNHGETIIEFPPTTSGSIYMKKKENVNFESLYSQYNDCGLIDCSIDDFKAALEFESEGGLINWKQKAKKTFTYTGIFELYSEVLSEDIHTLQSKKEELFLAYISVKFLINSKPILYENIKKSYKKIQLKKRKS